MSITRKQRVRKQDDRPRIRLTRNPLARMRLHAGYSSAELAAEKLGVSRIHLLQIERGASGASWAVIAAMVALYHVSEQQIRIAMRASQRTLLRRRLEAM